jgi:urease accessory protein
MLNRQGPVGSVTRLLGIALALAVATAIPAEAHHPMGGQTPATLVQGLLSGFGHPVIGIDHLAIILGLGIVVGIAGLNLAIPAAFIGMSAMGVLVHFAGVTLPMAELVIAASVILVGGLIASGRTLGAPAWLALFALAGLFHGYAYGEAIVGAESTPLGAYLAGLVIVQAALSTAVALVVRRLGQLSLSPRIAGAVMAGVGLATLAGQILPA